MYVSSLVLSLNIEPTYLLVLSEYPSHIHITGFQNEPLRRRTPIQDGDGDALWAWASSAHIDNSNNIVSGSKNILFNIIFDFRTNGVTSLAGTSGSSMLWRMRKRYNEATVSHDRRGGKRVRR